ncbi:MAG: type II toxin-antitoxin system Phd/YefM family antitoxin [Candidatus Promineifilaceae bacterium]
MLAKFSIAEARDKFASLIRDVEETAQPIEVTRRGQPVAVILSTEQYARLSGQEQKRDFWQAYLEWRDKWQVDDWEEKGDLFADLRDPSPGRQIDLWE